MENRALAGSQSQVTESAFIARVYLWMALGLTFSGIASAWLLSQPQLLKALFTNTWLLLGLVIVEVGLVIWLSAAAMRMSAAMATSVFLVYSFLNGLTLASIFVIYTSASIAQTFAITAGTFAFFSVYGITTKKDLTSVGSLAMMGLIGIILASVVNIFLKSSGLMWVTTFVGVAVFLALIAYDTQKLKTMHAMALRDPELEKRVAVLGALALYLDFINLFLLLLRIFGRGRD